ncbi:hypothetical protein LIER_38334 [Lithospermum erythrorhizon]|uniref:Transposase (putative) gypsy type domain-containing protein n=1 Tax=Lithospermum erythrorhizon TaxID=34254 RepID=A0AAV3Q0L2_LITER
MASKTTQQRSQTTTHGSVTQRTLAEGLEIRDSEVAAPEGTEAEMFAAGVLTDPDTKVVRRSRIPLSKRKIPSGEGSKRKAKKPKASKAAEMVEPAEEGEGGKVGPTNEPGVKDSQTFEVFRSRTMKSTILRPHFRFIRDRYSIDQSMSMGVPFDDETVDNPQEEGFTPIFWEFMNYGLRLRASPFVNSFLNAIRRAPGQLGPFAWAAVTAFQVGCLSVGVVPNVNLFARLFNVVHQDVLKFVHPRAGIKNMLYSEKPGKASPTRWHKYFFFATNAFSDDVPHEFCTDYTTLDFEESDALDSEFEKLVEGDLLLAKTELAPTPSKDSYKAVVSGASVKQRVLGSKAPEPTPSSPIKQPEGSVSDLGTGDMPEHVEIPLLEETREESPDSSPVPCVWHHGMARQDRPSTPPRSPHQEQRSFPVGFEEGKKGDPSFFVDTPFKLPSRVEVTEDTTSQITHPLVEDLFKNCMLKAEVLGAMNVSSPTSLHHQYAHYQLREKSELLREKSSFLREKEEFEQAKASIGTSVRIIKEERDSALARKDKAEKRCEELLTQIEKFTYEHAAFEGKLKSKVEMSKTELS